MNRFVAVWILLVCTINTRAQLVEQFSDGDFTNGPSWVGNTQDWLVNTSGELQSASSTLNAGFFLSTPSNAALMKQWSFSIRLQFNPSSANYMDVFIICNNADPQLPGSTGYFVRIGNSTDEVSLYRKDAAGITEIIDGSDGTTNQAANDLRIKIARDGNGRFLLFTDATGGGTQFSAEGSVRDTLYNSSQYFSILVKQSTASFFGRHFFDDLLVEDLVPDLQAPQLKGIVSVDAKTIDLHFDESPHPASVMGSAAITIAGQAIVQKSLFQKTVRVETLAALSQNASYNIQLTGITDLWGNSMNSNNNFVFHLAERGDLVISELMPDPSPPQSLPNTEYVELTNRSNYPISLDGWKLFTQTDSSDQFPSYLLQPDSIVVLLPPGSPGFSFKNVLTVPNMPTLPNEGTVLSIRSPYRYIHSIRYSRSWYANRVKEDGGWSLELVDPDHYCGEAKSWRASVDPSGGSPGKKNSVDAQITDEDPPYPVRSISMDSNSVMVFFNEPLDSNSAATPANYGFGGVSISKAAVTTPLPDAVTLSLLTPLEANRIYTLRTSGIKDCAGNSSSTSDSVLAGRPSPPDTMDVVINEILFDPAGGCYDYVELFNKSDKIIDISALYLANRNTTGAVNDIKRIRDESFYLFPGDYLLLTEDEDAIKLCYHVKHPERLLPLASLPSFPDDKGAVVILNAQGLAIDEVKYHHSWHFPLIARKEGVALERIEPSGSSSEAHNWQSAPSSAGYGTPGYANANLKGLTIQAEISLEPKIISPDNDGRDDFMLIYYRLDATGYMATVSIYDLEGRKMRTLIPNLLLGREGVWKWDGTGENGSKLPPGIYVILVELFNLKGEIRRNKFAVVVAGK